jgi:large subunit ribosomal protein L13e
MSIISPIVKSPVNIREGRGFSLSELSEAGLTPFTARMIGLPVDTRRKSNHKENVEILKEWSQSAKENDLRVPPVKQVTKGQRGRAYRCVTMAGKKMRGIVRSKRRNSVK